MLRGRLSNGIFILGLDAENVKHLKEGHPIMVALDGLGGTDTVAIMYGETIEDIKKELEETTGVPLPEPTNLTKHSN